MSNALLDVTEVAPATETAYEFSMHDRCDADKGATRSDGKGVSVAEQAYHRATKGDLELFFCDHHYQQHESALLTEGWKIESDHMALESMKVRHKVYSEVDGE